VRRTATLREEILAGVVAGIVAGILVDLFVLGVSVAGGTPLPTAVNGLYDFIASAAMGRAAFAQPGSGVALGVVLHFAVAIGWALGYVWLARTQPHLLTRPIVSGIGFGFVVFVFMNVALIAAGQYTRPTTSAIAIGVVAHLILYGLPVALIVSRMLPHPSTRPGRA
jgi:hypothetical protein